MPRMPLRHVRVYSENQLEDLWGYFQRFEVVRWVAKEFGTPPAEALAAADCLRQAREFADAAKAATFRTRPVLLYYSMRSLAKMALLIDRSSPATASDLL